MNVQKNSQAPKPLPASWRWVRLGEVSTVHPGQHIMEADYNTKHDGVGYLTGPNDFSASTAIISKWTNMPKVFAESGDILVTVKGAGVGKTNFAPNEKVAIGRQLMAVRAKPSFLQRDFLCQFVKTQFAVLSARALGATVPGLGRNDLESLLIPLPPLAEQKRIAAILNEQMAAVEKARAAAEAQANATKALIFSYVRNSLIKEKTHTVRLSDCLSEVKSGVGTEWRLYPVLGATRAGLALAKEPVGRSPERYKLVERGIIFYNPMRILLGSIALVDDRDAPGITSPDYVVLKTATGILHYRWFYRWFRSLFGDRFIRTLARGAVRERILYKRLSTGSIEIPTWTAQLEAADKITKITPLLSAIEAQLSEINALPAALLIRAFSGEL